MVTNVHVTLDDSDYDKIIKVKGEQTWREFLLRCCRKDNPQEFIDRSLR